MTNLLGAAKSSVDGALLIVIFGTDTVGWGNSAEQGKVEEMEEVFLLFVSECFNVVRMCEEVCCLLFGQRGESLDLEGICVTAVQEEDCGNRGPAPQSFESSGQLWLICVLLLFPIVPFLFASTSEKLDPWSMLFLMILTFDVLLLLLAPMLGSLINLS